MNPVTKNTLLFDLKAFNNYEKGAFSDAFLLYYSGLCYFAERMLDSAPDAEDVVEDLFAKIWQRHDQFQSEKHLKAFLYRATKNACIDFIKTTQHSGERNLHFCDQQEYSQEGYINEIIRAEMIREIHLAINELPAQASKVISMSYIDGLSNQEIATKMGLSIQTVKNQKGRALGILKKRLSPENYSILVLIPLLHSLSQIH